MIKAVSKSNKQKKRTAAAIALICAAVVFMCAAYIIYANILSRRVVPLRKYYGFGEETTLVLLNGGYIKYDGGLLISGKTVYFPLTFIKSYIDPFIFCEKVNGRDRVIITARDKITYITPDEFGGGVFINSAELTDLYGFSIEFKEPERIVVIDFGGERPMYTARIEKPKITVWHIGSAKSSVAAHLKQGEVLTVFPFAEHAPRMTVRTDCGIVGEVLTDDLEPLRNWQIIEYTERESDSVPFLSFDKKINMVWDQITTQAANSNENRRVPHEGLDVLSPTWFSFDPFNGALLSIADRDYVEWAHGQGYMVWGLVTDNFDSHVSNLVLTDPHIRDEAVSRLVELAVEYNLDGINVDFEMVNRADIDWFIQFLRELAASLRPLGKYTSADMYVPAPHNMYYNRAAVADAVDYVIVMAYDEYWSTSPVAGPNASRPFVEAAVVNTLNEVPKEKLILGIPFYVRIWTETPDNGGKTAKSEALSMRRAYERTVDEGGIFAWNDAFGCYYAEYEIEIDGTVSTRRVWLECERSIDEKLRIFQKHDIAGVAAWRRGLETPEIWSILNLYLN
jgi:spore germination protein YaaH